MFRTNLVVHHQEHGVIYCITQFGTIGTIVLSGEFSCYEVVGKTVSGHTADVACSNLISVVLKMNWLAGPCSIIISCKWSTYIITKISLYL